MCSLFFLIGLAIGLSIFLSFENISINFIDLFYCLQFCSILFPYFFKKKMSLGFSFIFPTVWALLLYFISTLIFITSFLLLWCLGSVVLLFLISLVIRIGYLFEILLLLFSKVGLYPISLLYIWFLLFTIFQCSMDLK